MTEGLCVGAVFQIRYTGCPKSWFLYFVSLAPVVQTSDSAIHRINRYPADSVIIIDFRNTYPLDLTIILLFPKPLFTEIEKNNCFSIYTRSDLNKIREETIQKYDLIDRSNHA